MDIFRKSIPYKSFIRRLSSARQKIIHEKNCQEDIRNIGIMAHIDAGKTTTSERMLFYSGYSKYIGEVHDGDTIMDYMEQERERGITITSAAITFKWNKMKINLIDTPGHVDFAMEVEKSLRVLDGAILVFDGSAGVEAQSISVWHQAMKYGIPNIGYINKMDKGTSSFELCLDHIKKTLDANAVALQEPIGEGNKFRGVVDLITMKKYIWADTSIDQGKSFNVTHLNEKDGKLWEECNRKRVLITDQLADLDNSVAQYIIDKETNEGICPNILKIAIRSCTIKKEIFPIYIGSSYKNIGVQMLMDGIIDYLPSPIDNNFIGNKYFPSLLLYTFKIIHHERYGALSYCRIFKGNIKMLQKIYNLNKEIYDKIQNIYFPYADELEKVVEASEGKIVVLSGLESTSTGDMLVGSSDIATKAKDQMEAENIDISSMLGLTIPQPVYECSIEAPSVSTQKIVDDSLVLLQREDPSLRVKFDINTQQTVMSGMGELHLEIIKDRLRGEYKVDVALGKIEVAYRETLSNLDGFHYTFDKFIMGKRRIAKVILKLEYESGAIFEKVNLARTSDNVKNLNMLTKKQLRLINEGIALGLSNGPILGFPIVNMCVYIHWFECHKFAPDSIIISTLSNAVIEAIKKTEHYLLEPVMQIDLATPHKYEHVLVNNLVKRRGQINKVEAQKTLLVIKAECPLSELTGISKDIRKLTSGYAYISMKFAYYSRLSNTKKEEVVARLRHW